MIIAAALAATGALGAVAYEKGKMRLAFICLMVWSAPTLGFIIVAFKNGVW